MENRKKPGRVGVVRLTVNRDPDGRKRRDAERKRRDRKRIGWADDIRRSHTIDDNVMVTILKIFIIGVCLCGNNNRIIIYATILACE